jgi:hypothetical protein
MRKEYGVRYCPLVLASPQVEARRRIAPAARDNVLIFLLRKTAQRKMASSLRIIHGCTVIGYEARP